MHDPARRAYSSQRLFHTPVLLELGQGGMTDVCGPSTHAHAAIYPRDPRLTPGDRFKASANPIPRRDAGTSPNQETLFRGTFPHSHYFSCLSAAIESTMPRVYRSVLRLAASMGQIGARAALPAWGALALAPSSKAAPLANAVLVGCAALALLHVIMFAMALVKQWANVHERAWNEARAEHSRPRESSASDEFGMMHRG